MTHDAKGGIRVFRFSPANDTAVDAPKKAALHQVWVQTNKI